MSLKRGERRNSKRFPYVRRVHFTPLSSPEHHFNDIQRQGYIVNVCKDGFKMQIRGEMLHEGSLLTVRMPIAEKKTTVPALAAVRWVKEQKPGEYHVGLMYMMQ